MASKLIVLDTNLWVSFLITKKHIGLEPYLKSKSLTLLFSEELLSEFLHVVSRPKFKHYFDQGDIQHLFNFMQEFSELIEVSSNIQQCKDETDNFLLNLCVDGNADYLVTGDNDLLELKTIGTTQILTYADFIKILHSAK